MRVLFVLPRMVSGGVERITLNLISMLRSNGVDCALALRRRHGELLDQAEALVPIHELAAGGMVQFVPNLRRLIRSWQPTHIVTTFADVGLLTLLSAKLARSNAAIVHGVHDSHGSEVAQPGVRGRVRHAVNNAMAGIVYRAADAVVATSEGVGKEISSRYRIRPSRVHAIHNPVIWREPEGVRSTGAVNASGPRRVVAIARLARQKGLDVLVSAMGEVSADREWLLDIYGEGPERSDLESRIARSGLGSRIKLRGYVADPYVPLREADILVLPSRHEGLPTILIEALACGVQVVATDCPHGPREILQDGRLGMLVPPEDATTLARAIERAIMGEGVVDPRLLMQRAADFSVAASYARWVEMLRVTRSGTRTGSIAK